jgi:hypothetical protein
MAGLCAAAAAGATRSGVAPAGSGGGATGRALVCGGATAFVGCEAEAATDLGAAGRSWLAGRDGPWLAGFRLARASRTTGWRPSVAAIGAV